MGEGFGHIFVYLNTKLSEKILEDLGREDDSSHKSSSCNNDDRKSIRGNGFSRGLGIGLGKNFAYVRKSFEFRIFAQALANTQFAIGLGEGLGYVFSYLGNELQDKILEKSNENNQLARGLGIGLGHVLDYLNDHKELQNRIFREMDNNKVLGQSIGACLSYSFSRVKDYNLLQRIITKAEEKSEFAKGMCLEQNFDDNIKCLNKKLQGQLMDICKDLYVKYAYDKNKFSFNDYPMIGFPNNIYHSYINQEVKESFIDDDMKEYLQMVTDEMKDKKSSK